jgi:glutathione S-transferase
MKLYGTTTSPFVRRVRIVAAEIGVPFEFIGTATPEGQKTLRQLSPIWKAPIAEIGGQMVFDSHVIIEHLFRNHGYGPLRSAGGARWVREQNLVSAADGALDSLVNLFQYERDGMDLSGSAFATKQRERAASILGWLEGELRGQWLTDEPSLGVAEIALLTALDWMVFRKRYPVETHPGLAAFREAHAERPSLKSTFPAD